jgi:transcriptional regulator with XRE-family HTH domain
MARAALGLSVDQLAAAAGIDRKTILRFEQGSTAPRAANVEAMRRALEEAGVRFAEPAGVFAPASSA